MFKVGDRVTVVVHGSQKCAGRILKKKLGLFGWRYLVKYNADYDFDDLPYWKAQWFKRGRLI